MTRTTRAVVLMADDDADDRALMKEAFEECGLPADLRFVRDGEELMDYLYRCREHTEPDAARVPDLLLLDLNMPRKDGREALREIKADPQVRDISVIVMTTSHEQIDVALAYELQASSFIQKPHSYGELVAAVRVLGHYWLDVVTLPVDSSEREQIGKVHASS